MAAGQRRVAVWSLIQMAAPGYVGGDAGDSCQIRYPDEGLKRHGAGAFPQIDPGLIARADTDLSVST